MNPGFRNSFAGLLAVSTICLATGVLAQSDAPMLLDGAAPPGVKKPFLMKPPGTPPIVLRCHLDGRIGMEVTVAADGHVEDVTVVQSTGHPALDTAVVDLMRQTQYQPATKDGVAIRVRVPSNAVFRLSTARRTFSRMAFSSRSPVSDIAALTAGRMRSTNWGKWPGSSAPSFTVLIAASTAPHLS